MSPLAQALQKPAIRRAIFAAYSLFTCGYLFWRVVFTWNQEHPLYSGIFLIAEIACILSSFLFYVLVLERREREPVAPRAGLTVDVLIATYNEDVALLRRTAVAARDMRYAHRTYLCDDGRRSEVESLARELGIGYITRPSNEHFKAGNLNNALARTSGDFVMVLDADHIPRENFLDKVLGHFRDPQTALVQTPQVYYNIDSFQHSVSARRRRFWHEAAVFHHAMQPGADRFNAAFFIGTGAVLRRSALDKIGGFATGSITEDIHTSMRLHAAGYQSAYVDEALGLNLVRNSSPIFSRPPFHTPEFAPQTAARQARFEL
ncbi:MAG: glycosyltransferase [Elusimicrobia bacterium]|nr:glycosyltransferase [Elusimicrobiota bacterium]